MQKRVLEIKWVRNVEIRNGRAIQLNANSISKVHWRDAIEVVVLE